MNCNLEPYAYVRFLHAIPGVGPVDISINGKKSIWGLSYENFTDYYKIHHGSSIIRIYASGTDNLILEKAIDISDETIYTAALVGWENHPDIELIKDKKWPASMTKSYIRFVNLSPSEEDIDIYLDGYQVITDMDFEEISNYVTLQPGVHTMKVVISDTGETVVSHPGFTLKPKQFYTAYITGLPQNTSYPMQVLIPLEGTTYLKFS